jgi:hypothetical protein
MLIFVWISTNTHSARDFDDLQSRCNRVRFLYFLRYIDVLDYEAMVFRESVMQNFNIVVAARARQIHCKLVADYKKK